MYHFQIDSLQLKEYETAPYFLQLSQNMTRDCLFTFVFSLNLPVLRQKLFYFDVHNKIGKNGEKHKSKQTIECHVLA